MIFLVTRVPSAEWDLTQPMNGQHLWAEHAAFMNALEHDRFILMGGPVGDASKFVFAVQADSEDAVRARLSADPWEPMSLLKTDTVERWQLVLGEIR